MERYVRYNTEEKNFIKFKTWFYMRSHNCVFRKYVLTKQTLSICYICANKQTINKWYFLLYILVSPPFSKKQKWEWSRQARGLVQSQEDGEISITTNADQMKEGTSLQIGFTTSDSTDSLLSSFLALLAENLSNFFNCFHCSMYLFLFKNKTEMLFGSAELHKNQKDLTILQLYKHLCNARSLKKSIATTKMAKTESHKKYTEALVSSGKTHAKTHCSWSNFWQRLCSPTIVNLW